jgi:membrane protein
MRVKVIWAIVREAGEAWMDDRAPRIGAAIAFFTALSLAPILVIALSLAGLVYGDEAARGEVSDQLAGLVGPDAAKTVEGVLANPRAPRVGAVALAVSMITLVVGASGVFGELQDALNDVWKVRPKPGRPVRTFLRGRVLSFVLVVGVGFLLLVSLVLTTALEAGGRYAADRLPGSADWFQAAHLLLALAAEVFLFGMIFKALPDVALAWKDVANGAVLTAVLFNIGKYLTGLYLAHSGVASAFGAAGSLMGFLVWIYYSALALIFGAEVAKVTAERAGRRISPAEHAEVIPGASTPVTGRGGPDEPWGTTR